MVELWPWEQTACFKRMGVLLKSPLFLRIMLLGSVCARSPFCACVPTRCSVVDSLTDLSGHSPHGPTCAFESKTLGPSSSSLEPNLFSFGCLVFIRIAILCCVQDGGLPIVRICHEPTATTWWLLVVVCKRRDAHRCNFGSSLCNTSYTSTLPICCTPQAFPVLRICARFVP
jgi:hypothetical protein